MKECRITYPEGRGGPIMVSTSISPSGLMNPGQTVNTTLSDDEAKAAALVLDVVDGHGEECDPYSLRVEARAAQEKADAQVNKAKAEKHALAEASHRRGDEVKANKARAKLAKAKAKAAASKGEEKR